MPNEFTPWQCMRAYETQTRKIEDHWIRLERLKKKCKKPEEEHITIASMDECDPYYTYFNNGKVNCCCKTAYDYNYNYCEGYDQTTKRCDRKHPFHYMNINVEEEYPCRAVPILTSTHYGFRPKFDPMGPRPKINEIRKFSRANGSKFCIDANGYGTVKALPTFSFRSNQSFGFTYAPPIN